MEYVIFQTQNLVFQIKDLVFRSKNPVFKIKFEILAFWYIEFEIPGISSKEDPMYIL